MRAPAYRAELAAWSRPAGAAATGASSDGVTPEAAGPAPRPPDLLPARPCGDQPDGAARDLGAYPLVAVLGTVGRALARP